MRGSDCGMGCLDLNGVRVAGATPLCAIGVLDVLEQGGVRTLKKVCRRRGSAS